MIVKNIIEVNGVKITIESVEPQTQNTPPDQLPRAVDPRVYAIGAGFQTTQDVVRFDQEYSKLQRKCEQLESQLQHRTTEWNAARRDNADILQKLEGTKKEAILRTQQLQAVIDSLNKEIAELRQANADMALNYQHMKEEVNSAVDAINTKPVDTVEPMSRMSTNAQILYLAASRQCMPGEPMEVYLNSDVKLTMYQYLVQVGHGDADMAVLMSRRIRYENAIGEGRIFMVDLVSKGVVRLQAVKPKRIFDGTRCPIFTDGVAYSSISDACKATGKYNAELVGEADDLSNMATFWLHSARV